MSTVSFETSAFAHLDSEGRLLKPTLKGPTKVAGRMGYRGDIGLGTEPPLSLEAVFATADEGEPTLSFLAGSLASYRQLPALRQALGAAVREGGKHFIYVSDLDRSSRYQIELDGVSFYVLPIDDTSVYNELIDYLYLDKMKMKKMDTAEKLDAIAQGAAKYAQKYESISFDQGLARL